MSIDTKASRAICDAATPGPWEWEPQEVEVDEAGNEYPYTGAWVTTASVWEDGEGLWMMNDANAEFCAHARTALPAALDEIERLRSALTIARQGLRNCRYAATPVQADEWATDALLRSSIEEHLAEADTGGKS